MTNANAIDERNAHLRRLETVLMLPDPQLVNWYNGWKDMARGWICAVCEASALSTATLQHQKPNCETEFRQIVVMVRYMRANGIPVVFSDPEKARGTAA